MFTSTPVMKLLARLVLLWWVGNLPWSAAQAAEPSGRFVPVDVVVESGGMPLASYQVLFEISSGNAQVVGLEGGEAAVFAKMPRHDPDALPGERVIIADFSLAEAGDLPRGRVRVATIHVFVENDRPLKFDTRLQAATDIDGKNIAQARASAQPAPLATRP